MKRAPVLLVVCWLLSIPCLPQDQPPAPTQRQTKLVVPTPRPDATPEVVSQPSSGHILRPVAAAFSRDGRTLVTCSPMEVVVWDVAGRCARWTIPLDVVGDTEVGDAIAGVATSPDGGLLAVCSSEGDVSILGRHHVRVWDTRERQLLARWDTALVGGTPSFSPEGSLVALAGVAGVHLWEARSGADAGTLVADAPVSGSDAEVVFRPDGTLVALMTGAKGHTAGWVSLHDQVTGRSGRIACVPSGLLSADGSYLVEGNVREDQFGRPGEVRVSRTEDGQVLLQARVPEWPVLAFSGRHAVTARDYVSLTDLQSGNSTRLYDLGMRQEECGAFSPDGTLLVTSFGVVRTETGTALFPVMSPSGSMFQHLFVDEGQCLAGLANGRLHVLRPIGGRHMPASLSALVSQQLSYSDTHVLAWRGPEGISVVPRGRFDEDGIGFVPDSALPRRDEYDMMGRFARTVVAGVQAYGLQEDGTVVIITGAHWCPWAIRYPPSARGAQPAPGQPLLVDALPSDSGNLVPQEFWHWPAFAPGGTSVAVCYPDNLRIMLTLMDVVTGQITPPVAVAMGDATGYGIEFLSDGGRLIGVVNDQVTTLSVTTGQCLARWPLGGMRLLAVSPDGSWAVTSDPLPSHGEGSPVVAERSRRLGYRPSAASWGAYIQALSTGEVVAQARCPMVSGTFTSADFSLDGDRLAVARSDGMGTLWDISALREGGEVRLLAALFDWPDGEWATASPSGYVDCSVGAGRHLAWQLGENVYPFEQFAAKYRRPDLVRRALAGEDISAERGLTGADVPPTAAFLAPEYDATIEGETAKVEIEVAGVRPLARVDLLIDGRPIPDELAATAKWEQIEPNHGVYTFELPLSQYQRRTRLQAIVHDDEGLQSMPAEVTFTRAGTPPPATVLHALSVGVSTYRNQEWNNLKYADKDAEAFAKVAGEGAARKVLLNENATASNVRFALEEMKATVTEDDVVAIFLAGHGTVDAAGNYYMLLHDSDVADLGNTALPWDDFVAALKTIRAKLVMVFADTCHSGSITGQESVNTLIDRLNRKAGVVVFTASRGDEASIEREDWGHGAFTKALLEGFGGEADTYPKDEQVSLAELRDYVIQRVEELTSGRQHPYLPRLEEFDPARAIATVVPDLK